MFKLILSSVSQRIRTKVNRSRENSCNKGWRWAQLLSTWQVSAHHKVVCLTLSLLLNCTIAYQRLPVNISPWRKQPRQGDHLSSRIIQSKKWLQNYYSCFVCSGCIGVKERVRRMKGFSWSRAKPENLGHPGEIWDENINE